MTYKVLGFESNFNERGRSFKIEIGYLNEPNPLLSHELMPELDATLLPDVIYSCLSKWLAK